MDFDIAVIGGGASGLACASAAVLNGASVAILERQPRVGKKLAATGNGRCNLYNINAKPEAYYGSAEFAAPAFALFTSERAQEFFESVGICVYFDSEGRAYPKSEQAASVVDCLRFFCAEKGVKTLCDFDVKEISRTGGGFSIASESGAHVSARLVVVAVGGLAAPDLGGCDSFKKLLMPFGHTFTRCLPALTQIKTNPDSVRGLKGVRQKGIISLLSGRNEIACERGEVLFTENGVSGIAAMQLSLAAQTAANACLKIPLIDKTPEEARRFIQSRASALPDRCMDEFLTGVINKRLAQLAVKRAGISLSKKADELENADIARLAREITEWTLEIRSVGGYSQAQVMAGGADTNMFDANTLMSRRVKGLYCCGELLDVTGPCGGYNLAWAWASGLLAGRSASESL